MTAQLRHRDFPIALGVCRSMAVLTIAVLLLAVGPAPAQAQDSPGYFGPIRFQRQVFTNIRPQSIRIPQQRFSSIPRQTIPPASFSRSRIVIPKITQTRIPRDTFVYSNSIFGPIDGVKAGQAAKRKQQPAVQYRRPDRSRSIPPLSR